MSDRAGFSIRPATALHSPLIGDLIQHVDISTRDLDWQHFLVAEDAEGKLIGCGQIKEHPGRTLELASIAVEPEWRGRGVARAIIEALLASRPNEDLYLMTEAGLKPMYAKFGFREITRDEMPTYFRRLTSLPGFLELWQQERPIVMHKTPST